ncbi:MAG: protein arginine kinase [Candidatus Omnitrophica bacterium]|nr:protein arginine kinase [Candidatus Omnitrophota bacterium]
MTDKGDSDWIDRLLNQTSEWLSGTGRASEVVISTRIRLARNLVPMPFSHWARPQQAAKVMSLVEEAVRASPMLQDSLFLRMADVDEVDKQFLIERHLMSKEHAVHPKNKALVVTPDERVSIMVNEEDHLRIQVMQSGADMTRAWKTANQVDDELGKRLAYAFSPDLGFLTACPTNVGTGMRASVMMHLPSLVITKQINKVLQAISKLSLTVRGLYGEGTEASGNFFQVSNQVSLGLSEEEIIHNLEGILSQVLEYEQSARKSLLAQNRGVIEDKVWRAYGILRNARIITSAETIDLLSTVRLGIDLKILHHPDRSLINELFNVTQPAHLQKLEGKVLEPLERDIKRASLIRDKLSLSGA